MKLKLPALNDLLSLSRGEQNYYEQEEKAVRLLTQRMKQQQAHTLIPMVIRNITGVDDFLSIVLPGLHESAREARDFFFFLSEKYKEV